jgi:NADH:ubiquinone reductase (H+-translocating)
MRQKNVYALRNLPVWQKVAISAGLLLGLTSFWSGWAVSIFAVNWSLSAMTVIGWGERLATLGAEWRLGLLAVHVASLALLLRLTLSLIQRMPLPRLSRRAIYVVALLLALLDVTLWLLSPVSSFARSMLGGVVTMLAALLGYLAGAPLVTMWRSRSWKNEPERPVRVVVVGGGFAGLDAALGLDRVLGYSDRLELTLIDRKNYFLFPPLLPSVSVGAIETRQVTYPFRRIFEATNIRFKKETVERIDLERRVIVSKVDVDRDAVSGTLRVRHDETPFDYLVLAPGSTTQTFGTPGTEHAFFMRELGDAIALRNHIIDCFETAARGASPEAARAMLRFVVIGAGPTGVEVASEVRDLVDQVLLPRYPELARELVEVVLVDSGERVLGGWNDAVALAAERQLAELGVRVLHGARVAAIGTDSVRMKDGSELATRTACWCAGVAASPLLAKTGLPLERGQVAVGPDCRVPSYDNVFVLGDAAKCLGANGRPLPPLGQVAFQQGAQTAKNLVRLLRGDRTRDFRYFDFGQLVSVGHQYAAVRLLGVRLTGFIAWFVWRSLYLGKLVGFGNKIRVMLDWTLDLFVERSSSQIHATRERLEAEAIHADSAEVPAPASTQAPRAATPRAVGVA